jgi:hypothetical protein
MVLLRLDGLEDIPYVIGHVWMYIFQCNKNRIKIHFIDPVIAKIAAKGQD